MPVLQDIHVYAEVEWADSKGKEVKNNSGFRNLGSPAPKLQAADVKTHFHFFLGESRSSQRHCDRSCIRFLFERISPREAIAGMLGYVEPAA